MASSLSQKKYNENEKVKKAYDDYVIYKENNKPSDYSFSDSELLSQTQNKYFNMPDFSYDLQNDPLYKQYRRSYLADGKKAMEDSIGKGASMTGGYGNSFALNAGLSSYNSYVDKLNNVIPELYNAAYSRYESEFDRLERQLGYLSDKNEQEYSRYLDSYNIYSDEVDDLRSLYLKEYENDINIQDSEWESAYKIAMAEQEKELKQADLAYRYYAEQLQQKRFEEEFEYKKNQYESDDKYREAELELERERFLQEQAEYWNDFKYKSETVLRDDEIYTLWLEDHVNEALRALEISCGNIESAKHKALLMGFNKKEVERYFDGK